MSKPRRRTRRPLNAIAAARLVGMLLHDACSLDELIDETGLCRTTVSHYVRALRREHAVYVGHWERDRLGRLTVAHWRLGSGTDAEKRLKPRAAIVRASRRKLAAMRMIRATAAEMTTAERMAA